MQASAALAPFPSVPSSAGSDARADAWQLLDDPAEWAAFGRPLEAGSGRWESQVAVEGMHCAGCAFTVEAALAQVPGVAEVQVNAASRRAT